MENKAIPHNATENNMVDEITLKDIILKVQQWYRLLLGKWKLLLLAGVLGAATGLERALLKTTTYKAELVFVTAEGDEGAMGKLASLGSQFGLNLGGGSSSAFGGENLLELMKSRRLVEQTLFDSMTNEQGKRVRLLEHYLLRDTANITEETTPVELQATNDNPNYRQDSLLASIHQSITEENLSVAKLDKKKAFIRVVFNDQDEYFTKAFVERLTDNVISFYLQTKMRQSKENIRILELKADSVENELSKAMVAAAISKDQNKFVTNTQGLVQSAKNQMQVQMLSTMYGEVVKNLELSKTMAAYNRPLLQVIDAPRFPLKEKKSSKLLGLLIGGFLAFFLMAIYLLLRKQYISLMRVDTD